MNDAQDCSQREDEGLVIIHLKITKFPFPNAEIPLGITTDIRKQILWQYASSRHVVDKWSFFPQTFYFQCKYNVEPSLEKPATKSCGGLSMTKDNQDDVD